MGWRDGGGEKEEWRDEGMEGWRDEGMEERRRRGGEGVEGRDIKLRKVI